MSEMLVSLAKLQKYCAAHGGYDLDRQGNNLVLSFVPSFPEAQEKGDPDHPPPRVIMSGEVEQSNVVHFLKVEIEDDYGITEKNFEDAKMTYESWLRFIEDNY